MMISDRQEPHFLASGRQKRWRSWRDSNPRHPVLADGCHSYVATRRSDVRRHACRIEAITGDRMRTLVGGAGVMGGYRSRIWPVLRTVFRQFATVRAPDRASEVLGHDAQDPHRDANIRTIHSARPDLPIVVGCPVQSPQCGQIVVIRPRAVWVPSPPVAGEPQQAVAHLEGFEPATRAPKFGTALFRPYSRPFVRVRCRFSKPFVFVCQTAANRQGYRRPSIIVVKLWSAPDESKLVMVPAWCLRSRTSPYPSLVAVRQAPATAGKTAQARMTRSATPVDIGNSYPGRALDEPG